MSAPQQSHCKVVVRSILPKQTTVSILGKQWEAGYSHVYNFYCSRRSCKLFQNNLYTDCCPCYILKWQCRGQFSKKERPKLPLLLHKKYVNFHSYYSRCEKMYNFMHLNVHIPDFLMKPFVLCFCSGRCRVYFYRGYFGFADVYSRQ